MTKSKLQYLEQLTAQPHRTYVPMKTLYFLYYAEVPVEEAERLLQVVEAKINKALLRRKNRLTST